MNPYNWQSHHPEIEIPRSQVGDVTDTLMRGGSAVVLGGRGMGKSVFLRQLEEKLAETVGVRVILVPGPPMELSARACLEQLAEVLDVSAEGALSTRRLFDDYFRRGVPEHLVLLFDEFDRYAESRGSTSVDPAGRAFFNDLELSRSNVAGLGILATGSLAVFTFRDTLGSSFLSRADRVLLRPFDRPEMEALGRPFAEASRALSPEVLDALYLASGGHPALTTYGLGALWASPARTERDVAELFIEFQSKNRDFLFDFQLSFADPRLSEAPQRAWELIQEGGGSIDQAELRKACGASEGTTGELGDGSPMWLDFSDVLDLLQATGLVRLTGSQRGDPVLASPIVSILTLPRTSSKASGLRQRLTADLYLLLSRLHTSSADFFRPGSGGQGKRLVPESVFAGFLAMGFELLGWTVDREAQSVAGRTDIRLRRNGSPEVGIVEVKIWGRNDYQDVHQQVSSYWSADTVAGAVVMLTDRDLSDGSEVYEQKCLTTTESTRSAEVPAGSPVQAGWTAVSRATAGMVIEVDHFLLCLPRGR